MALITTSRSRSTETCSQTHCPLMRRSQTCNCFSTRRACCYTCVVKNCLCVCAVCVSLSLCVCGGGGGGGMWWWQWYVVVVVAPWQWYVVAAAAVVCCRIMLDPL